MLIWRDARVFSIASWIVSIIKIWGRHWYWAAFAWRHSCLSDEFRSSFDSQILWAARLALALYEPLGMLTQIPFLIPISVSWHRYLFDHLDCATAGEALYTAFCYVSMLSLSLARAVSAFNTGLQTALYFVVSSSILRSRRFGGKTIDIIC